MTFPCCQCAPNRIYCRLHGFIVCAKESDKDFNLSDFFFCDCYCRGFVVTHSFSLPDFLHLREVDANKLLWKKRFTSDNQGRIILTLISYCQWYEPRLDFCRIMSVGINRPLEIHNLHFLIWHRAEKFSSIQDCHNLED